MNSNGNKPILLTTENYLTMIKNSIGSKMFRNCYALVGNKKKDLLKNGDLSCAYFVTSILKIFDLIGSIHLTVRGAIEDIKNSGWYEIKSPKKGSILVWEKEKSGKEEHAHIGFYAGDQKAISNSFKRQAPIIHNYFFRSRKVEAIFWNKKLDK